MGPRQLRRPSCVPCLLSGLAFSSLSELDIPPPDQKAAPPKPVHPAPPSPLSRTPPQSSAPRKRSSSPSPKHAQPLRISVGHTTVGSSKKRKALGSPDSGPVLKRKRENLVLARAAVEDKQDKARAPLGGVVAPAAGKAASILPPPNAKRKADSLDDELPLPRRRPLARSPSLMQPRDLSPLSGGTDFSVAQRFDNSQLAKHRVQPTASEDDNDEDEDDVYPYSFKRLVLNRGSVKEYNSDMSNSDLDSDEDSDDEDATSEDDADASPFLDPDDLGITRPTSSFPKSFSTLQSSALFPKSSNRDPPPFDISPYLIHSPSPFRPPSPSALLSIDPFLEESSQGNSSTLTDADG